MTEITFTEYCAQKIKDIDIERLANENNVVGVGQKIAELAQLMSRINQELSQRIWAYNLKVKFVLDEEKVSVAQARIRADASTEARDLLQCRLLKESVVEQIRSLKYMARSMAEEESFSGHT